VFSLNKLLKKLFAKIKLFGNKQILISLNIESSLHFQKNNA
jgi:hypothetical protein